MHFETYHTMQYHASPCHTMPCQYTLPYNGEPVGHISCHTKPDLSFCHLGCTIPYHSTQCCTISYYAIPWKTTWAHATRCHAFPSGLHPRPACALCIASLLCGWLYQSLTTVTEFWFTWILTLSSYWRSNCNIGESLWPNPHIYKQCLKQRTTYICKYLFFIRRACILDCWCLYNFVHFLESGRQFVALQTAPWARVLYGSVVDTAGGISAQHSRTCCGINPRRPAQDGWLSSDRW